MKTFVILGMHRSGTSLLAKALHTFDNDPKVSMGDIMLEDAIAGNAYKLEGATGSNPQGHFEDDEFMQLNERILQAAGGTWFRPPQQQRILSLYEEFTPEIKDLISKRKSSIWGWKDPRSCLTIDLFHPHIENPHYICMFRGVEGVADSLVKRDSQTIGITKEYAIELAKDYNRRIMSFLSRIEIT